MECARTKNSSERGPLHILWAGTQEYYSAEAGVTSLKMDFRIFGPTLRGIHLTHMLGLLSGMGRMRGHGTSRVSSVRAGVAF